MLNDLDETLKALLRERGGLAADEIDIAFEAPDREWSARVGKPTVNCYLYDIRENLQLRETDWIVERAENGRLTTKRQPPRRFDLSYVCTAWTSDIEDEHRLLWRVLATLIRHPELPTGLLRGDLAASEYPIRTLVAQPDGLLRDPADVWSALDNRIRPSVNFVATLPLADMDPFTAPLTLTKRIGLRADGTAAADIVQIAGEVRDAGGVPLGGVLVRVRDHAHATVTTADGRFWFTGLGTGPYTLVAEDGARRADRAVVVPGADYDLAFAADAADTAAAKGGKRRRDG
ncbi:MAG: hypothetical protein AVDCRST_MAG73-731 [uncultured Thermomicrobiales bacterium]|uniref:Pvc16 N-terminal domain-containing protein n=1 Tax=uncultured Thermomicrobiales bacterium TaxID=1645740 RepID=A0A6J4TNW0_9BACT|nr:MAG: hypothetical protein AVDCRST_MAG73-731 [uncultured Thermomicrobiales bacterium]